MTADEFTIPLVKESLDGQVIASLVAADPAPPARGNNTWRIELSDAEGEPISGLDLNARPFMPAHNHGTSATIVTATEIPGEYEISRINLWMGGVWEVRLFGEGEAADSDVVFYVSVPD